MGLNLDQMHFESRDGAELEFYSVEHLDNSQLKYFIKEGDCIFVRQNEDAYIQAKLVGIEDEDQTGNGDGYVDTELNLYKVSEKPEAGKGNMHKRHKKKKKKLEPSKTVLRFLINQSLEKCQATKDEQLWKSMPIAINEQKQVIGSLIYEEMGSDDLILEFFTAPLDRTKGEDEKLDYSQRPLTQTYMVDYPLLAYKNYTPENREICICHMAMDIPQKVIDLGEWEFICFVNHTQMVERKVFEFERESNCDIMFLAEREGKIRLMSFKSNPWLRRDEFPRSNQENIFKQSIFLFSGILARPKMTMADSGKAGGITQSMALNLIKNASIMGDEIRDKQTSRRYDADKIQNAQLITDHYGNWTQFTMIIQYNDSIATASLTDKKDFREVCGAQAMLRRHLIRGYSDRVFYAESTGNAEKLFQLNLHNTKPDIVVKKEIFQLAGSWIAALEPDCENIQNDQDENDTVKESLYILDDSMKIYHLVNEEDIKFTIENITDFSESGKLKQIIKLRDTDWSHVQITQRALTFDGDTYNLKSHLENKLAIPKHYYGEDKFMENQFDDEEEEKEQPDDEDAESDGDTDEWNIQSV